MVVRAYRVEEAENSGIAAKILFLLGLGLMERKGLRGTSPFLCGLA